MVGFAKETKGELFDSEESCVAFYSKPENLDHVKKAETGGNVLFQYLSIALFEKWVSSVEVALVALQDLVPECENELEDLAKILNVRVVDITQTPIKKSIPVKLNSQEIVELINKTGYNLEQDSSGGASFTMELSDSQYKVLLHAKTVYPENRAGRSLIWHGVKLDCTGVYSTIITQQVFIENAHSLLILVDFQKSIFNIVPGFHF